MANADQLERYSETRKRGCPTCAGIDPKSCLRCYGKTRMCDWYYTPTGWALILTILGDRWEGGD